MQNYVLNIGDILDIILKTTKKNANNLAHTYLIKDSSIISKWKRDKAKPTNEDILKIVDFTLDESSETQRRIIRNEIEILIVRSLLKDEIKDSLLHIADFSKFLCEVINISTASYGNNICRKAINQKSVTCEFNMSSGPENNRPKEYESDRESGVAFSDGLEGNYSGIVEFNLHLSKAGGESPQNTSDGKISSFNGNGDFSLGNKIGKLHKQLGAKSILGTILIVFIVGSLIVQAAKSSKVLDSNTDIKDAKVYTEKQARAEIKSSPVKGTVDVKPGEVDSVSESAASESTNSLPEQKKKGIDVYDVKSDTEKLIDSKNDKKGSSTNNEDENETSAKIKNTTADITKKPKDKIKSDTAKNSDNNTHNNIIPNTTNNSIDNSGDNSSNNITINKGTKVDGNNNIQAQGSNIFINVDK